MIDLTYTCDACGQQMQGIPRYGMTPISRPRGWYRLDGRDLCSLPCIRRYAASPDEVPAQTWEADPMTQWVKKGVEEKIQKAAEAAR